MASLLVLWDVDFTLVDAGGVGWQLYQTAYREMFGGQLGNRPAMHGRTDRAIAIEVLGQAGIAEPRRRVDAFQQLMAARAPDLADLARQRVRALPGAAAALAALAQRAAPGGGADGGVDGGARIVQSVLTGNMRPLAEVKLGAPGLSRYLDLDAGAFGDRHEERADLVPIARRGAALAYGRDFGGTATVLVGDTPLDVAAALDTGARAVGVATGGYAEADLAAAGAHAVLPDLADTGRVLAAILGPSAG